MGNINPAEEQIYSMPNHCGDSEEDVLSESRVVENALVSMQPRSCPSQKHLGFENQDRESSAVIMGATSTMPIGV